jgi:HAMP domain-containing protein
MTMKHTDTKGLNEQELLWVLTGLQEGNFTRKMTTGQDGAAGQIAAVINTLVDQLNRVAAEFTRITREIGAEGKYGGQAHLPGLAGTWKDLTDNLNIMGATLTDQVRDLSRVAHGLADGRPAGRATVQARGETLELKEIINRLVDQAKAR